MAEIKKIYLVGLLQALEKINIKVRLYHQLKLEDYQWCQEQALDLGEYLEGVYAEKLDISPIITALEDYCEQIYQLSITETREARLALTELIETDLEEAKTQIMEIIPEDTTANR